MIRIIIKESELVVYSDQHKHVFDRELSQEVVEDSPIFAVRRGVDEESAGYSIITQGKKFAYVPNARKSIPAWVDDSYSLVFCAEDVATEKVFGHKLEPGMEYRSEGEILDTEEMFLRERLKSIPAPLLQVAVKRLKADSPSYDSPAYDSPSYDSPTEPSPAPAVPNLIPQLAEPWEVNYRAADPAKSAAACGSCAWFIPTGVEGTRGVCAKVAGPIDPNMVCDLYTPLPYIKSVQRAVPNVPDSLRYTMGPWYVPDKVDAHGEYMSADELEQAAWWMVRYGTRDINLQHHRDGTRKAGEWVGLLSWPKAEKFMLSLPGRGLSEVTFPAGTVYMGVQWEPWAHALVKTGKLRGLSLEGTARIVSADFNID